MNSISFYCKLAAVLFCLSPNVANTDIVSYLEVILNKKKSKKKLFYLTGMEVVIFKSMPFLNELS